MPASKTVGDGSRVEQLLEELIFCVRLSVRDEAKDWFNAILDSPEKKSVYEACDARPLVIPPEVRYEEVL